jgi:hypothetical protein
MVDHEKQPLFDSTEDLPAIPEKAKDKKPGFEARHSCVSKSPSVAAIAVPPAGREAEKASDREADRLRGGVEVGGGDFVSDCACDRGVVAGHPE